MKRVLFFCLFTFSAHAYELPEPLSKACEIYTTIDVLPASESPWYLHPQLKFLIEKKEVQLAFDIGAGAGFYSIYLADILPKTGKVIAIDRWSEIAIEYTREPNPHEQFLSNVIHANFTDKIVPLKLRSPQAVKKLQTLNVSPDLIFINTPLDYDTALKEISLWLPLLKAKGIFCGDNWHIKGVSRAVYEQAGKHGRRVCFEGSFWWYEESIVK